MKSTGSIGVLTAFIATAVPALRARDVLHFERQYVGRDERYIYFTIALELDTIMLCSSQNIAYICDVIYKILNPCVLYRAQLLNT